MINYLNIILVAIGLSMDTFSLSISLTTTKIKRKLSIFFCISVGILHFIMPLIGGFIGDNVINIINISSNKLLGIILLLLSIEIALSKEENKFELNYISMFLLAISVSIDAFTVGFGLQAFIIDRLSILLIFLIVSMIFTSIGLFLGKIIEKLVKNNSKYIGSLILLIMSIIHLCK